MGANGKARGILGRARARTRANGRVGLGLLGLGWDRMGCACDGMNWAGWCWVGQGWVELRGGWTVF